MGALVSPDSRTNICTTLSRPRDSSQSFTFQERDTSSIDRDSSAVPLHPLGVKPAGNAYAADENIKVSAGFLALLPDDLIIQVLEYLDATALQQLQRTCKALYAFTRLEDLWKTLCIGSLPSIYIWRGTWRSTYLGIPRARVAQIYCHNLFSDVLYRPFFCANISLLPYARNIPPSNVIPRMFDISASDFANRWTNRPFILTNPVRGWPVYREWSIESLVDNHGDIRFRAESVDWPLRTYFDYMNENHDENQLYLMDRAFAEKMNLEVGKDGKFWAPDCFGKDLFTVLGSQRPDNQWLIVGPERSGSTFHLDPNATSAWNAVLKGSKYWILFPTSPSQPSPPGVFVSEDQSEVTSPLSIAEWLIGFHGEARRTSGCVEGVCNAGEVLYVPSGWWHLVVNLEASIAISENFVPEAHLVNALDFFKRKADQIAGFKSDVKNIYELFVQKMEESYPSLLNEALSHMDRLKEGKKRRWEELMNGDDDVKANVGGFSFGFGDGEKEDIP